MPKNRKKNNIAEAEKRPRIPNYKNEELMGVVIEILGGEHMTVKAEDGNLYLGLIRGKIKKRMWCRASDLVLIQPWSEMTVRKDKLQKASIIWRYTRTQMTWLQNHNYIKGDFLEEIQNV